MKIIYWKNNDKPKIIFKNFARQTHATRTTKLNIQKG